MVDALTLFEAPVQKGAILSGCGTYRYQLWRGWDPDVRPALFIGMNPSTADAEQDDPTIRRCIRFARDWGYGGLLMGNLFAYRATDPRALPSSDPMPDGELACHWHGRARARANDEHLLLMAKRAGIVIAAWGAITMPKGWERQPDRVGELIPGMHALGLTKDGHPRHPLYVKASARPLPLDILRRKGPAWSS
jgi:hypothetical protein